jgi:hypothetical protein
MPFLNKSTLTYPATNVFPNGVWKDTRDPTSTDFRNFEIGNEWINFSAKRVWFMVDRTATSGTWIQGASSGTGILTITGNSGGPVGPDGANNVNLVASGTLTVSGNPGTNTLTISQNGTVATSYAEDAGSAVPSAGVLKIIGGMGISTTGAGNTVTINASASTPLTFTEDAGTATPALNNLNVFGGTGITTSGAGSNVTIAAAATIAITYTADVGSATPAANNLNIFGAGSSSTSGAGSTITITSTGGGVAWSEITVVGPTQMVNDHGYITNNGSPVQLLLPLTSTLGATIIIVGKGAGGWQINQNAGQTILLGASTTTVGVAGTVASSESSACIEMVCITANTVWRIRDSAGNEILT